MTNEQVADLDWKSIDHELMFQLLSFPAEVEEGDRVINATWEITGPPDFEEWFIERRFYYCLFGLMSYKLSDDLSRKYVSERKNIMIGTLLPILRKNCKKQLLSDN